MNIIVCIKQVPDTNEVRINQETGTLIREGVPSIMNPDDKNALEEALRLKDETNGKVTVITMGPPQAKEALREAISMGADDVYLVSDSSFGGSDTWATSTVLTAVIEKIGQYDIIFCGRQAIDGDTAQVGPEIAEFLNIPQVTYASKLVIDNDKIIITRRTESEDYIIETEAPVLITAIKELNTPRYPTVKGIFCAYQHEIKVWNLQDLDIDKTQIGLKGSPTKVFKTFVPTKSKESVIIDADTNQEKSVILIRKMRELNLI